METKKFYGIDEQMPMSSRVNNNVMDALPQTIQRDYPETYHEMKRNSNHRQFPVVHAAAHGNHSNPMAAMVPEEMNREKQG